MTDQDLNIEDVLGPDDSGSPATDSEASKADTQSEDAQASSDAEQESPAESEQEGATPEQADQTGKPDQKDPDLVPVKAVKSERERRQAAERERDELRAKLAERDTDSEPTKKTSVFDDEERFRSELDNEYETKRQNDRYTMSHALAEDKWGEEKVTEAMDKFKALVEQDRNLGSQVFEAPLPYFEMMRIVERHEKMEQAENIDDLRERIRAEERERLRKELETDQAAEQEKRKGITPSLASARSASSGNTAETLSIENAEEFFPE